MLYKKIIGLLFMFNSLAFCCHFWYECQPDWIVELQKKFFSDTTDTEGKEVADPIDISSGAYREYGVDLFIPGHIPLQIKRRFSSRMYYNSSFGFGWAMNYDMRITEFSDGKTLIRDEEGYRHIFTPDGYGGFNPPAGENAYLIKTDTNYCFKEKYGTKYMFDTLGYLKKIIDRNGNQVSLAYTAQPESIMGYHSYGEFFGVVARRYLLTQVTDDVGRNINFYYNNYGRIDSIKGPASYKVEYTVNDTGNLLVVTRKSGSLARKIEYRYNNNHAIDSVINAVDETYLIVEYDSTNQVTNQKYGFAEYKFLYDNDDSINTLISPLNDTTKFCFNDKNLIKWIADAFKDTTKYIYDNDYKVTKIIGPRDDTTLVSYNFGDVLSVVDALSDTTRLHYTADFHMPDSIVDPTGHITKFEYDTLGNLTTVINALGKETEYEYDARGNVIQATDPMGHLVYYSYDPDDGLTHNTTLYGSETYDSLYPTKIWATVEGRTIASKFDYDYRRGLRVASGDPNGNITYFDYDSLNQLTKVYSSDNTPNSGHTNTPSMRYYYDIKGNMTKKENYYGHLFCFSVHWTNCI